MPDPYGAADEQRRVPEGDKRSQNARVARSPFERDRARVLHSSAFRRLADKTQVVVPGEDDFPRTRLTHSLEVAQLARELGHAIGADPDITDAAGLAHDLGHPPFGHNGEEALNVAAADIGGFEGNAQTLRILTRLEPKVLSSGRSYGLNLTRATLDATVKYPWPRRAGQAKFGYYADDREAYDWIRDGRADGARCIEAEIMEWADDVAYSVHDLEDGIHAGYIRLATIGADERAALCRIAADHYGAEDADALAATLDGLLALPALVELADYDRSFAALAAAKRATSELTGRFIGAAVAATANPAARYVGRLVVPAGARAECALLKAIAFRYVMTRPEALRRRTHQIALLGELVDSLVAAGPDRLDPPAAQAWREAGDDAGRLRAVIDQVAQLTDSAATAWHSAVPAPVVVVAGSPADASDPLDTLATEQVRAGSDRLESLATEDVLDRLVAHERAAPAAVAAAVPTLARAVDAVAARLSAGGRLIYVAAGTPGRLAMLDAAECVPTFGLAPGVVVAVLAGGASAQAQAIEGAEDRTDLAEADLRALAVSAGDCVVGITASGRTPYVLRALRVAGAAGALTIGIANNSPSELAALVDYPVELRTGPEVLSGSTRLTAGTAQKIALNVLSTATMIRLGKTYRGRMVEVLATNDKLRRRTERIVAQLTGVAEPEVRTALGEADGRAKIAVVMLLAGLDAKAAEAALADADGHVEAALRASPR
jgi:dGTPase